MWIPNFLRKYIADAVNQYHQERHVIPVPIVPTPVIPAPELVPTMEVNHIWPPTPELADAQELVELDENDNVIKSE